MDHRCLVRAREWHGPRMPSCKLWFLGPGRPCIWPRLWLGADGRESRPRFLSGQRQHDASQLPHGQAGRDARARHSSILLPGLQRCCCLVNPRISRRLRPIQWRGQRDPPTQTCQDAPLPLHRRWWPDVNKSGKRINPMAWPARTRHPKPVPGTVQTPAGGVPTRVPRTV